MRIILFYLLITGLLFAELVTELSITPSISVSEIKSDDFVAEVNIVSGIQLLMDTKSDLVADISLSSANSKIVIPEPRFLLFLLVYFMLINYRRLV